MICQFNNFADCRKQPNSFELINLSKLLCYALQYDADHRPDKLTTLFFSATLPSVLTIFGLQKIKRGSLNFFLCYFKEKPVFSSLLLFYRHNEEILYSKVRIFSSKADFEIFKNFFEHFLVLQTKVISNRMPLQK